ncbi:MAG: tetratricopeptide repeat protein [Pseudomonadota bacterium]
MIRAIEELQRRNVPRTAAAYLAGAWLLVEVSDTLLPRMGFTDAAVSNVIIVLAIGFFPALLLSWFFEFTADGIKRDWAARSIAEANPRNTKLADRLIVLMLILAVGFLAVDRFVLDPERDSERLKQAVEAARDSAEQQTAFELRDRSIAVLAFADMSPLGDQQYFSDGLAEEILNLLARHKELRVISRSSAFSFKGSDATIPDIAQRLDVNYVLEGSVRKADNRVRVTAQLIDATTDTHIWSETYDREFENLFSIQDEVSANILDKLQVTLIEPRSLTDGLDVATYDKFLKAQYIVHTSDMSALGRAQRMLAEVLEEAPTYIPAINALARSYYRLPKERGMPWEENHREIVLLANRVIELDPEDISALIWKGWFAYEANRLEEAAGYYEQAIQIDPSNTSLLRVLVGFLSRINQPEKAIQIGEHLMHLDPACAACAGNLAHAFRQAGAPEAAAESMNALLDWHAGTPEVYWSIGASWLTAGRPKEALRILDRGAIGGTREMGTIMALHDAGHDIEFEARFARYRAQARDHESVARIYAWTGDTDKAFLALNQMVEHEGVERLGHIQTEIYDKIKADPRWLELHEKNGWVLRSEQQEPIAFEFTLPD